MRKSLGFLVACLVLGCGPGSVEDDGGGAAESGSGGSCEQFLPTPDIGPTVAFRVRNDSNAPIYVNPSGCGGGTNFDLVDGAGESVRWNFGMSLPIVCEHFLGAEDCVGGAPDCGVPPLVRIPPGGSDQANWRGTSYAPMQMTEECASGEQCQRECLRAEQAAPGTYVLTLAAYRSCEGDCDCEGGSAEVCGVYGTVTPLDPFVLEAEFSYPEQTEVTVVAEP